MPTETEIKLVFPDAVTDELVLSSLRLPTPVVSDFRSVYFDTADCHLQCAGMSVRVRHDGSARIQTIKASGRRSAGLFVRPEWERPIESDQPQLDSAGPVSAVLGDLTQPLIPVFEVRTRRTMGLIEHGTARIEVAIDRGEVAAGDRRSSFSEIELELKAGPMSALFALTRELSASIGVRPGVLTKNERGYGLIGVMPQSHKAEPIDLKPDMSAAEAFKAIALGCLRHYRLNEDLIGLRRMEALHQSRVALRRLRSALSAFKSSLDEQVGRFNEELRWLAGELGSARDLDVLIGRCHDVKMLERLRPARDRAYDSVSAAIGSDRARTLLIDLMEWIELGDWRKAEVGARFDESARDFATHALQRYLKKLRKRGRGIAKLDDEHRHQVRKDAKKLRYATEFFAGLFVDKRANKRRYKNFVLALGVLQDRLGSLNDIATARQTLIHAGLEEAVGLADLLAPPVGRSELLKSAEDAYEELMDCKRFWK